MTNINQLLRDHVTLTVECLDRTKLNGCIPILQVPGQLVNFLISHHGNTSPSPALMERTTKDFADGVKRFAEQSQIPAVHFVLAKRKEGLPSPGLGIRRTGDRRKRMEIGLGVPEEAVTVGLSAACRRES